MARNVLSPLVSTQSSQLADWIELIALLLNRRHMSPAKARQVIASVGGDSDETDLAMAYGELHRRSERGLAYYPFGFSRLGLERRTGVDVHAYALLLLASASHDFVELADTLAISIALERLVTNSMPGLLGSKSRAVRFGYPPEAGRPPGFADAHVWLGRRIGARPLPLMGADLTRADGGIDVVAWRPHEDPLGPGPVAVVQVTFDRDLRNKSLEIAGSDFYRWYRLPSPVPVLATPSDGEAEPDLMVEISGRTVVLDRWRILACLAEAGRAVDAPTVELVNGVMADLEL